MSRTPTDDTLQGRISFLLWLNTVLTALILPLLGFFGSKVWERSESVSRDLVLFKMEYIQEREKGQAEHQRLRNDLILLEDRVNNFHPQGTK